MSAEELAKLAQNPVGNLISLPFQNNTNFNFGPREGTQNILNIQPVIPISVEQGLEHHHPDDHAGDLAARRSARASAAPTASATSSSPRSCRRPTRRTWIWGAGPVVQLPDQQRRARLATRTGGMGASSVVLHLDHGDPWVYGVLVNNVWSLTQRQAGRRVQQRPDPAVRQLQLPGRPLPDQRADRDGELEGRRQPAVDRAARRRRGQDLPSGQAAGEHVSCRRTTTSCNRTMARTGRLRAQVQLMFPK